MSPTYISAVVLLVAQVFPFLGINIGSAELTTTVTTLLTIVSGLVIIVRRFQKGDITMFGSTKK